ncbi:MAG: GNAT family N-acetyltransferase [Cyclobacteriaceae bacterium]
MKTANNQEYKTLKKQAFKFNRYSLVPIRFEDRYDIMKWRNEQIDHLRQNSPLKEEDQDKYFEGVIFKLFAQDEPEQILFSYLEDARCIGYGGLVHINWTDRNAELSFIMDTFFEKDFFRLHWTNYLHLIEKVGFQQLKLHKLSTYAYDIRPHLYPILEDCGFYKETTLKEQVLIHNEFIDVVIHSKTNRNE